MPCRRWRTAVPSAPWSWSAMSVSVLGGAASRTRGQRRRPDRPLDGTRSWPVSPTACCSRSAARRTTPSSAGRDAPIPSLSPSPLGILIHPEFGLWHALRGALLFRDRLELPAIEARPSPCDALRGQALPAHLPGRRLHAERLRRRLVPRLPAHALRPALHDPGLPSATGLPCRPRARLSRRAGAASDARVSSAAEAYSAACSIGLLTPPDDPAAQLQPPWRAERSLP